MENQNNQQNQEAVKIQVNDLGFGFVLTFKEEPTAEEFCNACISVFQTASMSLMQKEPINQALEEAKKLGKFQFVFEGQMNHQSLEPEARIAVVKERSKIIAPEGKGLVPGNVLGLNRAQRRSMKR